MPVPVLMVATAKVVLAWVFSGSGAGRREGGVQVLDLLAGRGKNTGPVIKQALSAIQDELASVIASESVGADSVEPVLLAVQDLFAERSLTVDELAGAGLDPERAAAELLRRGQRLLAASGLSEQERYLLERAVRGCYRAILSRPELLPGRDEAFQRLMLADITELRADLLELGEQLPDRVLAAIAGHLRPQVSWPVLVGRAPQRAEGYQPRADLRRVLDATPPGATVVIGQAHAGPGGVGKTQLAAGYAHDELAASSVELVVWVTAASRDAIVTSYAAALHQVQPEPIGGTGGDPEADASRWLTWLATTERRWLVVLDDLRSPLDLQGLWPSGPHGLTLVTTRSRDRALSEQGRRVLPVGLFTEDEALAYLSSKLRPYQLEQAAELANDLRHIPLALAQAAAVISDNQTDCAAYRKRLADQHSRLAELFPPEALADDYARTLANTWLSSIQTANRLRPAGTAGRLIRIAALLDPNGIPADLFTTPVILQHLGGNDTASTGPVDPNNLDSAAGATAPDNEVSPPPVSSTGLDLSLTAADAQVGLQNLRRVSLADIDPPGSDGAGGTVRVHELVQRASRETTPDEQLATDALACADALLAIWPEQDYQPTTALRTTSLRSNTTTLLQHAEQPLWLPESGVHRVLLRYGRSLDEGGLFNLAVDHWDYLHNHANRELGPHHGITLRSRNDLALAYRAAGRLDEAIPLLERTLTDFVEVSGERHLYTLTTRNNLASSYRAAGRLDKAIPLLEQTLTDFAEVSGERHQYTLTSRNNLASAYRAAGRFDEAIPLLEQTLIDRAEVLGERHPDTFASRNNLALVYQDAGRLDEAIPLYEQTLTDLAEVSGERHPNTLMSRNNLASAYQDAGRLDEAIPLLEQTLTDRAEVSGERHPDTLTNRNNLALAYQAAGRLDEAIPLLEQTLTDRAEVLGERHPNTFTSRNNLASAYQAAGRLEEAIPLLEQTLTDFAEVLGERHPNTFTSRNNLALAYQAAGRLDEAIPLLEQTLTDRVEVLGERHPGTLASRNNLAAAYITAERVNEADDQHL